MKGIYGFSNDKQNHILSNKTCGDSHLKNCPFYVNKLIFVRTSVISIHVLGSKRAVKLFSPQMMPRRNKLHNKY